MARHFIRRPIRSLLLAIALVAGCSDGEVNFAAVKFCIKFTTAGRAVDTNCDIDNNNISIVFKPGLQFNTDKNTTQTAAHPDADLVRITYKLDPTAGPTVTRVEFFDTAAAQSKARFLPGDATSPLPNGTKQVNLTYPTGSTGEITAAYERDPADTIALPATRPGTVIDDAHIFPK